MQEFEYEARNGDKIKINYIIEGDGEPLVLVHGSNTKLQAWNYQIDYFKSKIKVIAFDNRGSGKSSRPDYNYTMEMYVEDLKHVLDHLEMNEPIHLCGISLGGMIAQKFALEYPEKIKSLILLATEPVITKIKVNNTLAVYEDFENWTFEEKFQFVLRLIYTPSFKRKLKKDTELKEKLENNMNFIACREDEPEQKDYINQYKALDGFDVREKLPELKCPTLIMVGSADVNTPPKGSEEIHELVPNSELKILDKMRHGFTIENHEEVNAHMWEFLRKQLA